jgi:hypothetical protein
METTKRSAFAGLFKLFIRATCTTPKKRDFLSSGTRFFDDEGVGAATAKWHHLVYQDKMKAPTHELYGKTRLPPTPPAVAA